LLAIFFREFFVKVLSHRWNKTSRSFRACTVPKKKLGVIYTNNRKELDCMQLRTRNQVPHQVLPNDITLPFVISSLLMPSMKPVFG
jgi:hypothetical protein